MAKLNKKNVQSDIESNINAAFDFIDQYLPKMYAKRVLEILPDLNTNYIRVVKHNRTGPARIVAALKKVAQEEKELFE